MEDTNTITRILVFPTTNSLDYWFNYITRILMHDIKFVKAYKATRMILVKNTCLRFVIRNETLVRYTRGLRDYKIYHNIENELENDFAGTIKQLLGGLI